MNVKFTMQKQRKT